MSKRLRCLRQRLDRRTLRHGARPRRHAAVEVEVVLPSEPAAPVGSEWDQLAEQLADAGVILRTALVHRIHWPEASEYLELEPLTGVVLPHELRPGELHALAGGQQRPGGPPPTVAVKSEEQRREPRGRQHARGGDPVEVFDHRLKLLRARTAKTLDRVQRSAEAAKIPPVGGD